MPACGQSCCVSKAVWVQLPHFLQLKVQKGKRKPAEVWDDLCCCLWLAPFGSSAANISQSLALIWQPTTSVAGKRTARSHSGQVPCGLDACLWAVVLCKQSCVGAASTFSSTEGAERQEETSRSLGCVAVCGSIWLK